MKKEKINFRKMSDEIPEHNKKFLLIMEESDTYDDYTKQVVNTFVCVLKEANITQSNKKSKIFEIDQTFSPRRQWYLYDEDGKLVSYLQTAKWIYL